MSSRAKPLNVYARPGIHALVMALVVVCTLQNTLNVYAGPGIHASGHGPGSGMLSTEYSFFFFFFFFFFFNGTVVDNHYGKFIHDNIWYTDVYIHSDNHIYTSPSHTNSYSPLHVQIHAHLNTHIHPYPHVQDSYFHFEQQDKSYCQKLKIIAYYMYKLS